MTRENRELIDIDGVLYSKNELRGLIESCEELAKTNFILKQECRSLTAENQSLKLEIKDMRFTRKYLTGEEAGKQFAQELLHPDTNFIKAEEAAEQLENEVVGAMGSFLGDDY